MDVHANRHPSLPRPIVGKMDLTNSNRLLAEAKRLVPGLTQTMMKKPEMFAPGSFPVYLARGQGALVEDVDGQQYIDFICGLGANSLGHNHPAVVDTIRRHLDEGLLHSLPTAWEVSAARTLVEMIPGAEMARFFKTGADATSAAVRLARYVTGKEHLITIGYNGWHDHFMYDTPGVPAVLAQYTTRMPLFEEPDEAALLARIEQTGSQLAAVLLSVPFNRCLTREFMHKLRATCTAHGVLLIQDEVITGFRLAPGGAQQFFDVKADFVCLSKAIAAGMPLSAVAGPEKFLSKLADLQVSTTFGGELLSLAVCEAVLEVSREPGFTEHRPTWAGGWPRASTPGPSAWARRCASWAMTPSPCSASPRIPWRTRSSPSPSRRAWRAVASCCAATSTSSARRTRSSRSTTPSRWPRK
ncbi:aminotransferase class III-fold pyridoxal phosphate-dependent enzyme [Cystobacter fuscus]